MYTRVTLFKNFKYDNNYDYIKTFNTKDEQLSYFDNLERINLSEYDYIREHEPFNVELSHEYLTENNVNYLHFNNGYRDVYGFIVEKRYVNDDITELIFEIDVIQTFMFDFTIGKSFVERKVCTIDELTDYDEGLNIGEHEIVQDNIVLNKQSKYFAMFNGMKKQRLVFDENKKLSNVIQMPYGTNKPLTLIDGIQYPCYFMLLQDTYNQAEVDPVQDVPTGNISNNDVVNSARKLLGLPYIWGGNYPPLGNSEGTDCSGLCMWAYNDAGKMLEVQQNTGISGRWTTYTMIEKFTLIRNIQDAKAGDVIFSAFSSPGVPEHVVMITALSGGNTVEIIEAQQPGVPILERTIQFNSETMQIRRCL